MDDDNLHTMFARVNMNDQAPAEAQAPAQAQNTISIREVKNLIDDYGLPSTASRVHRNLKGNRAHIEQFLINKHNEKVTDSNSGIHKGGRKSRRSTRGRRHSKKHKRVHHTRRKHTRRHRHSHRRHHRH